MEKSGDDGEKPGGKEKPSTFATSEYLASYFPKNNACVQRKSTVTDISIPKKEVVLKTHLPERRTFLTAIMHSRCHGVIVIACFGGVVKVWLGFAGFS